MFVISNAGTQLNL